MKKLNIKRIKTDNLCVEQLNEILRNVSAESIGMINWDGFPASVCASFKIAHNGDYLFLLFDVSESEILAQVGEDNGKVSKDSCVEFFVSFDNNEHYYNIELSCIGKLLMGYRDLRPNAQYASEEVLASIKRHSTLGTETFDKKDGNFSWQLSLIIPKSAFWGDDIKTFNGFEAKANFYKCGDNLTQKHYLSWSPIGTEKPSFHERDFFGILKFE